MTATVLLSLRPVASDLIWRQGNVLERDISIDGLEIILIAFGAFLLVFAVGMQLCLQHGRRRRQKEREALRRRQDEMRKWGA